jgi:hypothetical protein
LYGPQILEVDEESITEKSKTSTEENKAETSATEQTKKDDAPMET